MSVRMYNIRTGTNRWQMHDFLFDGNSNICIFQSILVTFRSKSLNNIHNYAIRLRISACIKVTKEYLCASSYRLQGIDFLTFDLENLCQGHVVEKLELRRAIVNINLHKSHKKNLCTISYHLRDVIFLSFDLENLGQGHVV